MGCIRAMLRPSLVVLGLSVAACSSTPGVGEGSSGGGEFTCGGSSAGGAEAEGATEASGAADVLGTADALVVGSGADADGATCAAVAGAGASF